jgi:hypothetical protein
MRISSSQSLGVQTAIAATNWENALLAGDVVMSVDAVNDLRSLQIPQSNVIAFATGYWVDGDGGGGAFHLVYNETLSDNGGTVIASGTAGWYWIRFYSGSINVRWFGACTDVYNAQGITDDVGIQAAIDNHADCLIFIPNGNYTISQTLSYVFDSSTSPGLKLCGSGNGNTILRSTIVNDDIIRIEPIEGGGIAFAWGSYLADFTLDGGGVSSNGILVHSCSTFVIERVFIERCTEDGINIKSILGDLDGSSLFTIQYCYIKYCNKWGINIDLINGTSASTGYNISSNYIVACGGGVRINGHCSSISHNSISLSEIYPHIYLPYNGVHSQQISIINNYLEKARAYSIVLEGTLSGTITGNHIADNDAQSSSAGIVLGCIDGGCVSRYHTFANNRFSVYSGLAQYSAYKFYTNASNNKIINTQYLSWNSSNPLWKKYDDAGVSNFVEEVIDVLKLKPLHINNASTGLSEYTPDLNQAIFHRITINHGDTFSIHAPVGSNRELILYIFNIRTDGDRMIDVNFDSSYYVNGYINPVYPERTAARFLFDSYSNKWIQIGGWTYIG